jgi:acyl-CoA thioesterase FadM
MSGQFALGVTDTTPITFEMPVLTDEQLTAFREATRTEYAHGVPLTFATIFRKAEFEWVDRVQMKVQSVLHAEQEYHYLAPLQVGDRPVITTSLKNLKGRSGMFFLVLESTLKCKEELKLTWSTTFVLQALKESV